MPRHIVWTILALGLPLAVGCGPNLNTTTPAAAYKLQTKLLAKGDTANYASLWSTRWKSSVWPRMAAKLRKAPAKKLALYGLSARQVPTMTNADMLTAFLANPRLRRALPKVSGKLNVKIKGRVGIVRIKVRGGNCEQAFLKEGKVWRIASLPYCMYAAKGKRRVRVGAAEASSAHDREGRPGDPSAARPKAARPADYDGPRERELVGGSWCDVQDEEVAESLKCRRDP